MYVHNIENRILLEPRINLIKPIPKIPVLSKRIKLIVKEFEFMFYLQQKH
jgi:hypothetical protein